MENSFLGSGMKFPLRVNPGTGRFAVSEGNQSVKESVYIILMTNRGERWLLPEFGSSLLNYTFMDTGQTMLTIMANDIRAVLTEQEPRISNVDVSIEPTEQRPDCLIVNINYTVSETNTPDNFVFPFYLTNAEGAEMTDDFE
jgi:hypothetical protein